MYVLKAYHHRCCRNDTRDANSKQCKGGREQRDLVVQLPRQGERVEGGDVHDAGQETVPGTHCPQVRTILETASDVGHKSKGVRRKDFTNANS